MPVPLVALHPAVTVTAHGRDLPFGAVRDAREARDPHDDRDGWGGGVDEGSPGALEGLRRLRDGARAAAGEVALHVRARWEHHEQRHGPAGPWGGVVDDVRPSRRTAAPEGPEGPDEPDGPAAPGTADGGTDRP